MAGAEAIQEEQKMISSPSRMEKILSDLPTLVNREAKGKKLQKLPSSDFYLLISETAREEKKELERLLESGLNAKYATMKRRSEIRSNLVKDLLENRIRKVLILALFEKKAIEGIVNSENTLTQEEETIRIRARALVLEFLNDMGVSP
ncbi:MAG: hypothetical protein ACYCT2_04545 [Thermoplasmataceae archaeon]